MDQHRSSERIEFLNDNLATLFDLSNGGASIRHTKTKAQGSLLLITLNDLVLRAKVVYGQERNDGTRLGVQFQGVPADKQKILVELVEKFSRGVPIRCLVEDDTPTKKV